MPAYRLTAERQVSGDPQFEMQWSPDGKYLLLQDYAPPTNLNSDFGDGAIVLLDANTLERALVIPQGRYAVWSPDSRMILYTHSEPSYSEPRRWLVYALDSHQSANLNAPSGAPIQWFADNTLLYRTAAGLFKAPFQPANPIQPLGLSAPYLASANLSENNYVMPSPDGASAFSIDNSRLDEWHVWLLQTSGTKIEINARPVSIGNCCIWSPDSHTVAFFAVEPRPGIYLVDRDGGNLHLLQSTTALGKGELMSLSFAPDSQTLAFEWSPSGDGFPSQNTVIYLVNTDGNGFASLTGDHFAPHRSIQWAPDGRHIAFQRADRTVWFADVSH